MISIRDYFNRIDGNGDGQIDQNEFRQLAQQLGLNRTEDVIDAVFGAIDADGDGLISRSEFRQWWDRGEMRPDTGAEDAGTMD
ncbi:MAG: EF-hand domain-containing protein [Xanthomonadales bacterium]|nr:EF-hand domain-containing protein [Xanthomonadales bacterium]